MNKFSSPLDSVRVASPCPADWERMYGTERKRFCSECKLNVYNLSEMTREEAETFLLISEGRVCVRYFRRADGTILTKNCPVGWKATMARASRIATASLSLVTGVVFGMFGLRAADSFVSILPMGDVPAVEESADRNVSNMGELAVPFAGEVDLGEFQRATEATVGRVERIERIKDQKVVAWVE